LYAAVLDREAAPGLALRGRQGSVPLDDLDARKRHVQLLGHDLGQRRTYAGAQIDLAGIKRNAAPGVDRQEGIHFVKRDGLRRSSALGEGSLKQR